MINTHPLISFIIPCYNVQDYIEDCIESIRSQSYHNFEIIAVDDRSSDSTFTILSRLASIEHRLKIVRNTEKIGGASYARNLGLKVADGDYIAFVDSDDIVSETYLEDFISQVKQFPFDIVTCRNVSFYKKSDICNIKQSFSLSIQCNVIDDVLLNFDKMGSVAYCLWGKIIRFDLIKKNNIKMDTDIHVMEDGAFMMDIYGCTTSLSIIPQFNYYYRIREKSLIHSVTKPQYIQLSTSHWLSFLNKLTKKQLDVLINNNQEFIQMLWRTSLMYKYMDCALTHSVFAIEPYKEITHSVSAIDKRLILNIECRDKTDKILLNCIKRERYFIFSVVTRCKYLMLNAPQIYNMIKRIMRK